MKLSLILVSSLLFGALACCQEKEKTTRPMIDKSIPAGEPRARAAAANVTPELEPALSALGLKLGDPVFIRAFKQERQLELFLRHSVTGRFKLFRAYPIAGSSGTLGPKLREGDGQVPEGFYQVPPAAMKPDSQYHLAFNIGFPNPYDRFHQRTGSSIMIHGNQISIGCLAMTDEKIEEIYTLCAAAHRGGQPFFRVHLFPFHMTPENLALQAGNPNHAFWRNLQEGYLFFEQQRIPPDVTVLDGRYRMNP
jgi:murein L,D-transpeptidase YafK